MAGMAHIALVACRRSERNESLPSSLLRLVFFSSVSTSRRARPPSALRTRTAARHAARGTRADKQTRDARWRVEMCAWMCAREAQISDLRCTRSMSMTFSRAGAKES